MQTTTSRNIEVILSKREAEEVLFKYIFDKLGLSGKDFDITDPHYTEDGFFCVNLYELNGKQESK
jgi:hypothetical protein